MPSSVDKPAASAEDERTAVPPHNGGAARFFDERKFDRGLAKNVTVRAPSLGGLTVLNVTEMDPSLAAFLRALDNKALRVERLPHGGVLLFKWASAYADGDATKIQGVLERE